MATTGWKLPSANAVLTSNSVSWGDPNYAYADDSNYVKAVGNNGPTDVHVFTGYGFTTSDIPSGATIDGIEVNIYFSAESDNSTFYIDDVQIYDGSALVGTSKATSTVLYSWTDQTLGGAADLWGTTGATLSDADIRGSGFGISIASDGWSGWDGIWVDYIRVRVHYTEGNNDVDVSVASKALTITEYAATITLPVDVSVSTEALAIATHAASLSFDVEISAAAEALAVTTHAASLTFDVDVQAPGLGAELFSNGTLDVDTTGWTAAVGAILSVEAGRLRVTNGIASYGFGYASGVTVQGRWYAFGAEGYEGTDQGVLRVSDAPNGGGAGQVYADVVVGNETHDLDFIATGNPMYVRVGPRYNVLGEYVEFDNFTMREIRGPVLTITPQAAAITLDKNVGASAEGLAITTLAAGVTVSSGLSVGAVEVTLTTHAATIGRDVAVSAQNEALSLTTFSCTVGLDITVSATQAPLQLATQAVLVGLNADISAAAEGLVITTYQAEIVAGVGVTPDPVALTLTTHAAAIDINLQIDAFALQITEQAATVSLDIDLDVGPFALQIAANAATRTYDVEVTAGPEALSVTPLMAQVLGEVVSTSRRADPFANELSWNRVDFQPSDNLAEPTNSGSNSVTVSPPDDNEVEV